MPWAEARRSVPGALVRRLQAPLAAGHVRQAVATAFIFLLVTLLTMACGAALMEGVMNSHVRELVLGTVQAQEAAGWTRLEEVERAMWQQRPEQRSERVALVVDAQGQVRYGQEGLWQALGCEPSRCHGWHRVQWRDIDARGTQMELLGLAVPLSDGGMVYQAYDVLPMLERVRPLPLIAGAGLFVVVLLSIVASMRFGARSLSRVEDIRRTLQRYAAGDTGSRVDMQHAGPDELQSLALSVNQALDRINALMDEVRDVSGHIAHELRTPLTRLHNRLSAALDVDQVPGIVQDEIAQAIEEVERIRRMSNAVLRIGAIESGRCSHQFEAVPLQSLLQDVAEYFQPLAEDQGVALKVEVPPDLQAYGDRSLLMQALSNLLDNALKYAAMGKEIRLHADLVDDTHVEVSVSDFGPGIAPLRREHVQMRFVRLEGAGRRSSGYGLGLSLVQAIVRLHGGTLTLSDNPAAGGSDNTKAEGVVPGAAPAMRGLRIAFALRRAG